MEFIVGIIGNLISDLISGANSFLFQNITDNVKWEKWKANHNLSKNQNDFLNRYAETLILLKKRGKPKELIRFYGQKSVINIVHDYWYGNLDRTSLENKFNSLIKWFTLNKRLEKFSGKQEVTYFFKSFGESVNENRTAGETEIFQKVMDIWNKIRENESFLIPKYLTPIPTINIEKEFIGREADIQQLAEKLKNSSRVVLMNGIGGIGKTIMALAYVQKFKKDYDHLIWIYRGEDIISSVALNEYLIDNLGFQFKQKEELDERFNFIFRKLGKLSGKNLMVIDNVQEKIASREIYEVLPSTPNWKILFTSRLNLNGFDHFKLSTLKPSSARKLFKAHYKGTFKSEDLDALLNEIAYHTLAIELLAKLLDKLNNILSLQELTKILRQKQLSNPDLQEKIWTRHSGEERGIYIHLMKAFELTRLTPLERWLLKQFVVLPIERYSVRILATLLQENPFRVNKILNSLAAKGWITLHEDKTFSIHRLIRQVVEYQLHPKFSDIETLVETIIQKMDVDAYTSRILGDVSWINYAVAIENFITTEKHQKIAILQTNIALTYYELGQYNLAMNYCKKAVEIRETILDSQHPDLAIAYNNIANMHWSIGQYEEALRYHKKALAIRESVLDNLHPDLAKSYNNIAITSSALGNYDEVLNYLKKALTIRKSILNSEHPDLAMSYNNIALTLRKFKKYEEALEYDKKAIAIRESVLEKQHPDLANSYSNIALTLVELGQNEEALKYEKKALSIRASVLDDLHPNLASSYHRMANIHRKLGQYKEALDYHRQAHSIWESSLDPLHPYLALSYNKFALTYHAFGKYKEALEYHKKAVTIREQILDSKNLDLAHTYEDIANTYHALGKLNEAKNFRSKARAIINKKPGST